MTRHVTCSPSCRRANLNLTATNNSSCVEPIQDATSPAHILVVDDEPMIRRIVQRILEREGYRVSVAGNGREAQAILREVEIDSILSDISMPDVDGMELLCGIHQAQTDIPVILMTGVPTTESATRAVRLGAVGYLGKPVDRETLLEEVSRAVRLKQVAKLRKMALGLLEQDVEAAAQDRRKEAQLRRAIDALFMVYQPIVSVGRERIVGYEALVRSEEPGLADPGTLFAAADRYNMLEQLRGQIRKCCVPPFVRQPGSTLFLNLHAQDLADENLCLEDAPLSGIAERVILEVPEQASLQHLEDNEEHITRLRDMGFRIAIDDIGAGYAGLSSFAMLEPDIVKLDRSLVHNVEASPIKHKLIRSLTNLCNDLNIEVIAEGVETVAERDALLSLGCDLFQGYLFSRPTRGLRQDIILP